MTTSHQELLVTRHGAIANVAFNRPEALNSFNGHTREAFPALLRELEDDPAVRVIVISGEGSRGFCAGADIKEGRGMSGALGEWRRLTPHSWIESLDRVTKPTIAAIHGICLGGGLEIALACDIRIATPDARLGLPETKLGLIPGGGGTQRLPRLIGAARAMDMLLTGEEISGSEAHRIGLVSRLAESREHLMPEALRVAELIASRPPAAIAFCKQAVVSGASMPLGAGLAIEKGLFAILTDTDDYREASAAFKEKRPPVFHGR
jgi:enoyl-CoA hydratase/carnithine racemase